MPFVKKVDSLGSQPLTDNRKIFIGRTGELLYFKQNILKAEDPTHNIISIYGQGGVGKSTLLVRFIDEAHSTEFKDYCLTAIVDERQLTPVSIMEKFAEQLHIKGKFEKALSQYKEVLRKQQAEPDILQDTLLHRMPDFAGAAAEGIPFVGPIVREGVKVTAGHLLEKYRTIQTRKDKERLENPIGDLTRAFVLELNRLTDTQVSFSSHRIMPQRHIILFFDTFEQLSIEAVPWLLDYFLQANISNYIVLVVAGRDPIERSTPDDPKRWLPYLDDRVVYSISLDGFTVEETRAYLARQAITDPDRMATIWQLSRGLPLYLSLLTSNSQGKVDPTKDVVDNFLRWIPQQEQIKRRLVLDAALLSKPFNEDDLEAFTYLPELERHSIYGWLIRQPFVRSGPQDGRYTYHEVAQELFSRHLYQRSQKVYFATRRALADHYERLLGEIQGNRSEEIYSSSEWLDIALAPVSQWFFLQDESSHLKIIERVLSVYKHTNKEQDEEIARVLHKLSEEQTPKQLRPGAARYVKLILEFLETNISSQESLVAVNTLLEELLNKSSFPKELLAPVYRQRGRTYYSLDSFQLAIADFNRALELDPNYDRAYSSRGWAYYWLKDYPQAFADFNRALELDPNYTYIYYSRGWAYTTLNNYRQAIADYNRALELDPDYAWAYDGRGWAYYWLKDYPQALADFNRDVELDPNNAQTYYGRGWANKALKNYQQAITDFSRALELNSNYAWAYGGRGITYSSLKEYQRALADFNRAIELDPNDAFSYLRRGYIHLRLNDIKHAESDFIKSWELDPKHILNGWMGKWASMCLGRPAPGTAEWLESIAAINPQLDSAYGCRGTAKYLRKHFEDALTELEQAILLEPEKWNAYFWKGMVCASLGRDGDAITAIEKAMKLDLPTVLLAPLCWFEQDRPEFYEKYAKPLLTHYEQACI